MVAEIKKPLSGGTPVAGTVSRARAEAAPAEAPTSPQQRDSKDIGASGSPPQPAGPSPAEREQAIRDDPLVKKAVEVFGGRVVHVEPRKKES